ncbi:MAG: UxaA family hydrolase, partial [Flavisolibacter sp.]
MVKEDIPAYLKIHPDDNVLVALKDLASGTIISLNNEPLQLQQDVAAKHKFFIRDMEEGEEVIMYGTLVGKVQTAVSRGSLVTTGNTKHAAGKYAYRGYEYQWKAPDVSKFKDSTFNGYHRSDGRVGTANYWLFIPTVFCENRNLDVIKEALHKELGYAVSDKYNRFTKQLLNAYKENSDINNIELSPLSNDAERFFKNVDGIKFLNHQGGCGGTRQ